MPDELAMRKFVAPEFVFGPGARLLAGRYARNLGGRRVLVVSDPGVVGAGWAGQVVESLAAEGLATTLFSKVTPNPRTEEVMAGVAAYREAGCNAIVAVGGGSPMDCAKGIGIVCSNHRPILEFEGIDRIGAPMPPLICIPTTAGTSADVSQFAIFTDSQRRVKVAIVSKAVVPDVALIDPQTLPSMGPYLGACTGLDALTHAIEAHVSSAHSPMTDLHALEAIRLLVKYLPASLKEPENLDLRGKVMLGSLQAGLAFSNAILGAAHAMAHSLGGYLDLPHGECNAILLDEVIAFNYPAAPERFDAIARAMGLELPDAPPEERCSILVEGVRSLKRAVGLTRHLGDLGVTRKDLPGLSRHALTDPCMVTNPRFPDQRDIEVLYEKSL
ncbi:iron-containing alcohol dehydrogenase [Desulfuromonas versatilis]|uniref:Iron-containing alcohol dehydrogenase n=1 Tax=Desulfuromonas versatilis TaxID=2802975 RepID=A0ABM8HTM8_9BACT|nr:alcohol dehydrogenase-like regulatory protein ErcA [Desulfuromonas versatilis]BCR03827.1 iron-containing alcohol dehydrogenase [Desulfuromonas versatilis]